MRQGPDTLTVRIYGGTTKEAQTVVSKKQVAVVWKRGFDGITFYGPKNLTMRIVASRLTWINKITVSTPQMLKGTGFRETRLDNSWLPLKLRKAETVTVECPHKLITVTNHY